MPKTKSKKSPYKKKHFFRLIHLQAVIVLVVYFIISNFILISSAAHSSIYVSFFVPFIFGFASTLIFFYLFSHEDFFHFIRRFEKEEKSKEKGYLNRFVRYGRIMACIIVAAVGGPIFLALTIRFLFSKSENRYMIAFISVLSSTIFMVAFARGLFNFIKF